MKTILPLLRNAIKIILVVICAITTMANLGINVAPLLAGAGVVGLAIGFGSQQLVQDVITGLFIIIEDTLSIGDWVVLDSGHAGTVEGLTIRTVRLRDIDGIVHTIPFSEIKSIKNYSREFGYAIFRVAIPYNMEIDDAIKLMREVGQKMRTDPLQRRNIWSPLEIQGVESFESGSAILRARFKTAPIKQWEVSRAFNLSLKRHLDEAGLDRLLEDKQQQIHYEEVLRHNLMRIRHVGLLHGIEDESNRRDYLQEQITDRSPNELQIYGHPQQVPGFELELLHYTQLRKEPRYIHKTPVAVKFGGQSIIGWTRDISTQGLQIELEQPLGCEREEIIKLSLPKLQELSRSFKLQDLPYRVVNVNATRTVLNLCIHGEIEQHQGRKFFNLLIDRKSVV